MKRVKKLDSKKILDTHLISLYSTEISQMVETRENIQMRFSFSV